MKKGESFDSPFRSCVRFLATCFEVDQEEEKVVDVYAEVGRAGARAIVEIGGFGACLECGEEVEQVVDVDAVVGRAGARAVVKVDGA